MEKVQYELGSRNAMLFVSYHIDSKGFTVEMSVSLVRWTLKLP